MGKRKNDYSVDLSTLWSLVVKWYGVLLKHAKDVKKIDFIDEEGNSIWSVNVDLSSVVKEKKDGSGTTR